MTSHWVVIVEEPFLPADTGGRVEHLGFVCAALEAGLQLTLIVPSDEPLDVTELQEALRERVPSAAPPTIVVAPRRRRRRDLFGRAPYVVSSRPLPSGVIGRLSRGRAVDAVVSYSARVAHLGIAIAEQLEVPHLVRCHNRDSAYFRRLVRGAAPLRRLGYAVESVRMARFERELHASPHVDVLADLSSADAAWRAARTAHRVVHVAPFLPRSGAAVDPAAAPAAEPTVLFVGSLDVESNVVAVGWLLREVWPRVRGAMPTAQLQVVGRRPGPALAAQVAAAPGATLVADAPSLAEHLEGAWVSVNPALAGSGVNIKLIEAMAAGLPCVTTSVGARGLAWRDGRDLLVADGAVSFAEAVVALLRDRGRAAEVAGAGRTWVLRELAPALLLGQLAAALTAAGGQRGSAT